jgi:hypothetical protein
MSEKLNHRINSPSIPSHLLDQVQLALEEERRRSLLQEFASSIQTERDNDGYRGQAAMDDYQLYDDDIDTRIPVNDVFDDEYVLATDNRPSYADLGIKNIDGAMYGAGPDRRWGLLPSRRALAYIFTTAVGLGVAGGGVYAEQVKDPNSVVASLPFAAAEDPAMRKIREELIVDCTDNSIGNVLFQGNVSASADLIWNIPNEDGTVSQLQKMKLDGDDGKPETPAPVDRHPQATIDTSTLSVGVCDTSGNPAIKIKGGNVKLNLNDLQLRVYIERGKAGVDPLPKEYLDATVATTKAFSQATADAVHADTLNPEVLNMALNNALYNAGEILLAPGTKTAEDVHATAVSKETAYISAQLAKATPGVSYTIQAAGEAPDPILFGMQESETDKFTIDGVKITGATITTDSAVESQ